MKSMALAATGFLLFLTTSSTSAEDTKLAVRAAITVYTHIVGTEAIIDTCRRIDVVDTASYDKVYQKYKDEISDVVVRIGFLVGRESRRTGADKQSLFRALDTLIDKAVQTSERLAQIDPERFSGECKTLPKAIIEKKNLFEPLAVRFPQEMKLLQ
jgi:hypothetical protein